MSEWISAVLIALAAFLATNLDNLLSLVGLMLVTGARPRIAALGYLLSVAIVVGLSLSLGAALGVVDSSDLRWLGLAPLGLGVVLGLRLIFPAKGSRGGVPAAGLAFWASFGTSLSHSADSLMVYGSLFSESNWLDRWIMAATIGLLACGGVLVARYVATHPRVGARLRKVAPVAVPVLLIIVGVYILLDSPTDVV